MTDLLLLPHPQKLVRSAGTFTLRDLRVIRLDADDVSALLPAGRAAKAALEQAGCRWTLAASDGDDVGLTIAIDPSVKPREGYQLTIDESGAAIAAHDAAGAFYGAQTFAQLVAGHDGSLPALTISDWPDFPARGVMLDVSRSKVPTMATLKAMIDRFASWKINQVQLYTEHSFAYRAHPEVWAQASPITAEEILELDVYCRERFIELVPNQNSFGHLERWLKLPRYRDLAIVNDGAESPWGWIDGSNSINPCDPRSLELIAGLYDELLPNFSSRLFNVGCDETYDLGQGKTKEICEQRGTERVYLDFLHRIHGLIAERGRTMQFWGDIILHKPELVGELPKDVIAMEWGYEATHPFDKECKTFRDAGVAFYVCPGTSSWNSICGRWNIAIGNLRSAAENGLKHGAIGFLNTDWGDWGHLHYLPISWLGFAYGAAVSWAFAANQGLDMERALSQLILRDRAGVIGSVLKRLGSAFEKTGVHVGNATLLFNFLRRPLDEENIARGAKRDQIDAAEEEIAAALADLERTRMDVPDAALIVDELRNGGALLRFACKRGRFALDRQSHRREDLATDLRAIMGEHQRLWLARNRPGGMREGLGLLQALLGDFA